jgi:hypothetical protein
MEIVVYVFIAVFGIVIAFSLFGKNAGRMIGSHRVGGEGSAPGAGGRSEHDHDQGEREYTDYGRGTQ